MSLILILLIQLIFLIILTWLMLYFLSMMISDFFGVPFVPTTNSAIKDIFERVKIKKKDIFYDLGCGDGRLSFFVNERYGCHAIGVELNPLLYAFARFKARFLKKDKVSFEKKDLFEVSLKKATVIYLFLFPEVVQKLKKKILKEAPAAQVISHGFVIKGWEKYLTYTLDKKPFKTYYYKLKKS